MNSNPVDCAILKENSLKIVQSICFPRLYQSFKVNIEKIALFCTSKCAFSGLFLPLLRLDVN